MFKSKPTKPDTTLPPVLKPQSQNPPSKGAISTKARSEASSTKPSKLPPLKTKDDAKGRPAYLLHRDLVIGRGSYGQVCIASREAPANSKSGKRRKFASKCVTLKPEPKYIAKLQEEVCVLKELRGHPFIIQLYDVLCIASELFIITELGRGGDLFHLLTTHPKHGVTEAYAAKSISQMLSAVTYMHEKNIAHRDLKLENWVLMSPNAWSDLKLIDFGLSTHFERTSQGTKLMSRVVGSSYYVSPQVLKRSYTEACDLWSLGVIAYMLLSGAPPFFGASDTLIKQAIVNGTYTFPTSLFKDVSEEAKGFVCSLLSYAPEYRLTARQALNHPWLLAAAPKTVSYSTSQSATLSNNDTGSTSMSS
ncbi:hypothetical protein TrLO_g3809 [Triparma laevis f. longispina]|uniref:Protein kinase domain-containing protein n=1 Tax=Triparma laevis f. longispina TaxID=1714387 RepID=A0A9W6ZTJ9_9STRA|nr:hypothetical protein TrLO_g3809 [Triparma laevis f. longispina]